ncbi:sulfatase-like hydrolase/transferase [Pelagibius litoralis]|uniref:Sulfatase-like hydrolase/transferase n=1 Tax=Pelagibius litoralis TaxID=374515 RepID=A0A967F0N1_9PROT|nr:sulfatase-like hydrolase/transferase [Pelagibius litoralis]NIA70821.1 sulfatase-like hydrolase/transferase [Pelagibius litoralis]
MTQPNVLLIVTDHWSAGLLGAAGHPAIQTPVLDQLARNGVRFTSAYSEHPVCLPARRSLMTGTSARRHGDRSFQPQLEMPADLPTLAQTFRDAGYQAQAVGKIHVYPQRDRIGFDDVLLDDEGRTLYGTTDDYEIYLGEAGYLGRQYDHGMSNNTYTWRPWHLPEETHPTNWATRMTARAIKRRDPTRPSLWYCGYRHPHPPLVPLQSYVDLYRDIEIDAPVMGAWAQDRAALPYNAQATQARGDALNLQQALAARRAFYALCTHIDHQIGSLIGTLRDEGVLDDTIVLFTTDHGDMLGNHGMWAKQVFYEGSCHIPMILMGVADDKRVGFQRQDDRLVCLRDVMPTLLDLCGIALPEPVEGLSMLGDKKRETLYGEFGEGPHASRMLRRGSHKLIWYPCGNRFQLFDLGDDPQELHDRAGDPSLAGLQADLTQALAGEIYGSDEAWVKDGALVGEPGKTFAAGPNRSISATRGRQWPVSPANDKGFMQFYPESK